MQRDAKPMQRARSSKEGVSYLVVLLPTPVQQPQATATAAAAAAAMESSCLLIFFHVVDAQSSKLKLNSAIIIFLFKNVDSLCKIPSKIVFLNSIDSHNLPSTRGKESIGLFMPWNPLVGM